MVLILLALIFVADYSAGQGQKACHDLDTGACTKFFAARPDMCQDLCIAKICQDTCRYCPTTCYHCDEEASPEDCKTDSQCATTNQVCIAAERYTHDFHVFYTSGCAEKELCRSLFGFESTKRSLEISEVDKRSYRLRGGCCDSNLCNLHDPGNVTTTPDPSSRPPKPDGPNPLLAIQTGVVKTNDTCYSQDLDTEGCRLLHAANSTICDNDCIATQVCPNFCGTCLECKNCGNVDDAASCLDSKKCQRGQKCVTVETLDNNFNVKIRLGCMDKKVCDVYFSGNGVGRPGIGKRQFGGTTLRGKCCDGNLCNQNGIPVTAQPGK